MWRNEAGPRNRNRQVRCSSIPRGSGGSSQFNSSVIIVNNNIFSSNTASLVDFQKSPSSDFIWRGRSTCSKSTSLVSCHFLDILIRLFLKWCCVSLSLRKTIKTLELKWCRLSFSLRKTIERDNKKAFSSGPRGQSLSRFLSSEPAWYYGFFLRMGCLSTADASPPEILWYGLSENIAILPGVNQTPGQVWVLMSLSVVDHELLSFFIYLASWCCSQFRVWSLLVLGRKNSTNSTSISGKGQLGPCCFC